MRESEKKILICERISDENVHKKIRELEEEGYNVDINSTQFLDMKDIFILHYSISKAPIRHNTKPPEEDLTTFNGTANISTEQKEGSVKSFLKEHWYFTIAIIIGGIYFFVFYKR